MSRDDPWVSVTDIKAGDSILWADLICAVERVSIDPARRKRRGRWFHVRIEDGAEKRLAYFNDERVVRLDGGRLR